MPLLNRAFDYANQQAEQIYLQLGTSVTILAAYDKRNENGRVCKFYRPIPDACGELQQNIPCDFKLSSQTRDEADFVAFRRRYKVAVAQRIPELTTAMLLLIMQNGKRFVPSPMGAEIDNLEYDLLLQVESFEPDGLGTLIHARWWEI